MNKSTSRNNPPKPRMASLDVFRGLTVAGMILVNMFGLTLSDLNKAGKLDYLGWVKNFYLWIDHADWNNSWNLADFVFPFFLHIVGMSMVFSIGGYEINKKKLLLQKECLAKSAPEAETNEDPKSIAEAKKNGDSSDCGNNPSLEESKSGEQSKKPEENVYVKVFRRAIILFLIGILINGTIYSFNDILKQGVFDFSTFRITGVLQRIALADAISAVIVLRLPTKILWNVAALILIGYFALITSFGQMDFVAINPCPAVIKANTVQESNEKAAKIFKNYVEAYPKKGDTIAAYIDRKVIPVCHSYGKGQKVYDPEGLTTTLPAIVSVLLGYFHGAWIKERWKKQDINELMKISNNSLSMIMFSLGSIILGILWNQFFPINKALWTSSYVLFTAGWALLVFTFFYELIEVQKIGAVTAEGDEIEAKGISRFWILPFAWMGKNPLFAFVASILMIKLIVNNKISSEANIYQYFVDKIFGWAGDGHDLMLFAIATTLFWILPCYLMYRKRWFIKF